MYMKQNFENYPGIKPQLNSLNVSNLYIEAVLRGKNSTAISLVAALGLSACGGGGGGSTTGANTQNPSGSSQNTTGGSSAATDGDDASDNSGGAILGGGGGGGGGGVSSSNNLTLSRSGGDYVSSSVSGFTLLGTDSHYQVADASNDAYSVKLTASGTGMLTFEFADADDTVTLASGSSISGFTQLKVIRGTVDVSDANIGGVTYVSVASSVKFTTVQVLELDAIVISAASGGVEVLVQSQDEIDQITSAITNGSLNLFSPVDDLMTLEAAPGASVTASDITTAQSTINTEKRAVSEAQVDALITIAGSNGGLIPSERLSGVEVNIFPASGSSAVSARVDGVDVGSIVNNSFTFNASNMTSGFHTLSVTTENSSGAESVTQQEFLVVGSSNSAADMFEFRTSKVGDVVTVDAYVKNLHSDLSDGIRSYDFWIDLDQSKFDYVEGSFAPASGSINDGAENQTNGEIFANGFFQGPWSSYDDALFSFQAVDLASSGSMTLNFVDFDIYRTDFGNFSVIIDV